MRPPHSLPTCSRGPAGAPGPPPGPAAAATAGHHPAPAGGGRGASPRCCRRPGAGAGTSCLSHSWNGRCPHSTAASSSGRGGGPQPRAARVVPAAAGAAVAPLPHLAGLDRRVGALPGGCRAAHAQACSGGRCRDVSCWLDLLLLDLLCVHLFGWGESGGKQRCRRPLSIAAEALPINKTTASQTSSPHSEPPLLACVVALSSHPNLLPVLGNLPSAVLPHGRLVGWGCIPARTAPA